MGTPNLLDWIITAAVVASGIGAVLLSLMWRHLSDDMVKKDARESRPRKKKPERKLNLMILTQKREERNL
jgi:hypothetical protein